MPNSHGARKGPTCTFLLLRQLYTVYTYTSLYVGVQELVSRVRGVRFYAFKLGLGFGL